MIRNIRTYLTKFLICLIALPVLSVLSLGLWISASLSIIAGILRTFGVKIMMGLGEFGQVPQILSLPFAMVFSAMFSMGAFYSWKLFKKSYEFIKIGHK